jgi:hypothetical protein
MKLNTAASRRSALYHAALLSTMAVAPTWPALAALDGDSDSLASSYAAGSRAEGGRGANALLKKRAESGVRRIGGDPLFKAGQILDTVRATDGRAVDITFAFPSEWSVSKGPNLDVRDVRTSDSAFLLVADLPSGKTIDKLSRDFFTSLVFAPEGKYGAYGGVDGFTVGKDWALVSSKDPSSGMEQQYRQFSLSFDALTYNANTVNRRAKVSATALGGSVFILFTSCLGSRYEKGASRELVSIQQSFQATSTSKAREAVVEAAAAAAGPE